MNRSLVLAGTLLGVTLNLISVPRCAADNETGPDAIDFARDIQPLLKKNCVACHREKMDEGGLKLENHADLIRGGDSGPGIVANNVDESLVFTRASSADDPMPPEDNSVGAVPLTPEQLDLMKRWINQGAPDSDSKPDETIQWQPIPESVKAIYATDVSPDGQSAAVASANRMNVFDLSSGKVESVLADADLSTSGTADVDMIQSVAFSPLGDRIVTGGYRTLRIWKPASATFGAHSVLRNASSHSCLSSDRKRLATTTALGDIEIWDLETDTLTDTIRTGTSHVTAIAWAGNLAIAVADRAGLVQVIATSGGDPKTHQHDQPIRTLVATADGQQLIATDETGRVVGLTNDESLTASILPNLAGARMATFVSQPKPAIAVMTENGVIHVVALQGYAPIYQLKHEGGLTAIASTDDGTRLASADNNGKVILWNLADGKAQSTLIGSPRLAFQSEIADRDVARETATVKRMEKTTETLTAELKKEDELLKKVTEEHKKAGEEFAAQQKKEGETKAKLQSIEDKLAAAKTTFDSSEKTRVEIEALVTQMTTAMQADTLSMQTLMTSSQQAQATLTKIQQEVTQAQQRLAKAQTEFDQLKQKIAAAQAAAEEKKKLLAAKTGELENLKKTAVEAKKTIETSTEEIEAAKKEVAKSAEETQKKEKELAKRKQAFDTATVSQARAAAAIPSHKEMIANRIRLRDAAQRSSESLKKRLNDASAINDIEFSPDGKHGFALTLDGTVRLFDSESGRWTQQYAIDIDHKDSSTMGFYLDSNRVGITGAAKEQQLLQPAKGWELAFRIGGLEESPIADRVTCMDFHKDGEMVVIGSGRPSRDGQVMVYSSRTGQLLREFNDLHSDTVLAVKFSPDGNLLATAAADKSVRLIDLRSGKVLRSLDGHTHHVLGVAWSSDGLTVATCSADKTVKVWDSESGKQKRTISGFGDEVTAIEFRPDSPNVVTVCADGQIRVHDVNNGRQIRNAATSGDYLFTVSLAPDGKAAVSGGQNGVPVLWSVDDMKQQRTLGQ